MRPRTKILVYSSLISPTYAHVLLQAGAAGYVSKHDDPTHLPEIVRTTVAGDVYISPLLSRDVMNEFLRSEPAPPVLTPRQTQILTLIAHGHNSKEVASALHLSVRTVHVHRSHIMRRLHVHTEMALVRAAMHLGLISPHELLGASQ